MKTYVQKQESMEESWYLVDAKDQILGRLAARVAALVRGKLDPGFTPHVRPCNHVVIVNSDKIKVTGNKLAQKQYHRHSGHPGGLKSITLEKQMAKDSTEVIRHAVKGMLPKNSLGRSLMTCVRVFAGSEHTHAAQQPQPLVLKTRQAREDTH